MKLTVYENIPNGVIVREVITKRRGSQCWCGKTGWHRYWGAHLHAELFSGVHDGAGFRMYVKSQGFKSAADMVKRLHETGEK